jgi:ABC-type phosphate transport system substrate-binding protein
MEGYMSRVSAFGKLFFTSKRKTIPSLPDMNLLVLYNQDVYQAICIDLEVDAIGNSVEDSCNKLLRALFIYIEQMVENYDSADDAVKDIINMAYSTGKQKEALFTQYIQAKKSYILKKLESQ